MRMTVAALAVTGLFDPRSPSSTGLSAALKNPRAGPQHRPVTASSQC